MYLAFVRVFGCSGVRVFGCSGVRVAAVGALEGHLILVGHPAIAEYDTNEDLRSFRG